MDTALTDESPYDYQERTFPQGHKLGVFVLYFMIAWVLSWLKSYEKLS